MSELTETLRKKYADDLKVLAEKPWVLDPKQCEHPETWQETADMRDLLMTLEHAERELKEKDDEYNSTLHSKIVDLTAANVQIAGLKESVLDAAETFGQELAKAANKAEEELDSLRTRLAKAEESEEELAGAVVSLAQELKALKSAIMESFKTMRHLPMCGCDHEQNDPACHVGVLKAALTPATEDS